MASRRETVLRLAAILWYGLLAYLSLIILGGPVHRAATAIRGWQDARGILDLVEALLGLVLLVVLFFLLAALVRWSSDLPRAGAAAPVADEKAKKKPPAAGAFPAPVTVVAGVWLLVVAALSVAGLAILIAAPDWLEKLIGPIRNTDVEDLLVTAMAGAVGGSVSTLLAYLKHASEDKNFDPAYLPWYVARPLLGVLLGLITFFLVKGGLLATLPEVAGKDFNNLGLAGLGSLVGMFSKNAVEKLREVFHTIFSTHADARHGAERALLARLQGALPAEVWSQVQGVLKPSEGDGEEEMEEEQEQEAEEKEEEKENEKPSKGNP